MSKYHWSLSVSIGLGLETSSKKKRKNLEIPCRDPVIFDYKKIINVLHVDP